MSCRTPTLRKYSIEEEENARKKRERERNSPWIIFEYLFMENVISVDLNCLIKE